MNKSQTLPFGDPDTPNGFRLARCEVLNWGTFDGAVWSLTPKGRNTLITGDIGSGKSTLIDALTTLFVPAHRIVYNAAAGAERRERDLRSYVLGYYKRERDDLTARPVSLRDEKTFSVILAEFSNLAFERTVTLAQVFYFRPGVNQPERFFVVATEALNIVEHFGDFNGEVKRLKKRLRQREATQLFDAYPDYSRVLCKALSIRRRNALGMLYQTVSMKSVGNLTEFVRRHMLEAQDTSVRIDGIIQNFHNLSEAYRSVVEARRQIERLTPIVEAWRAEAAERKTIELAEHDRDNIDAFIAHKKCALFEGDIAKREARCRRVTDRQAQLHAATEAAQQDLDSLACAIWEAGGSRLDQIDRDLTTLGNDRDRRRANFGMLEQLCMTLDLTTPISLEGFHQTKEAAEKNANKAEIVRTKLQNLLTEKSVTLHQRRDAQDELDAEIEALKSRRSNIPRRLLALRARLAKHVGVEEDTMPFAGELIRVRDREQDWEGAIERLLHNFALSLLVTPELYNKVNRWVDQADLKGRIVYFKITEQKRLTRPRDISLVRAKIDLRQENGYTDFLENAFAHRFDHTCANDLSLFRRVRKALTKAGQIKGKGERHEKDDTHRVDDRRRFVLGWSNERKLRALAAERERIAVEAASIAQEIERTQRQMRRLEERLTDTAKLTAIGHFDDVDFHSVATRIEQLREERDALRASSDELAMLEQRRAVRKSELAQYEQQQRAQVEKLSSLNTQLERDREDLDEATELARRLSPNAATRLDAQLARAAPGKTFTVRNASRIGTQLRESVQADIAAARKRQTRLQEKLVRDMQAFKNDWPERTTEVDAAVEAGEDYATMLEQLTIEDLPRFEQRFEALLREQAIHDIVLFSNDLDNAERAIRQALERINRSLTEVSYDRYANTYIHLLAQQNADPEVREFRKDLREVAADTLSEGDHGPYSEAKFHEVRRIVERLKGRETHSEADRRWRAKVTDVRNWFVFSVSERFRSDDSEREHFTDSSGKSGGQKEKLAYTILATALAYQFDLDWNSDPADNFRFAMIDEAFGRGSDESARYGLELFAQLNLQLLIVTPMQKIHVIEDYVSTVGFVHNVENTSALRQLTIEEYRAGKAAQQLAQVQFGGDLAAREER